jgi:NADH-quinone oxidoreductase subunit H
MVTVSALATTLFLGGWRAPWPISLWESANTGWWPMLWFFGKVSAFIFVFIWLRGTLPRLRYDQFMKFGWKFLLPVSIGWIVVVATARALRNELNWDFAAALQSLTVPFVLIFIGLLVYEFFFAKKKGPKSVVHIDNADPFAGGHPVPPMQLQQKNQLQVEEK